MVYTDVTRFNVSVPNARGRPIPQAVSGSQATSSLTTVNLERREWLIKSLEGLERWEAKHGLGQDDDV